MVMMYSFWASKRYRSDAPAASILASSDVGISRVWAMGVGVMVGVDVGVLVEVGVLVAAVVGVGEGVD